MADKKLVSRRKFLKISISALGAGVITCGGAAFLGLRTPSSVEFPESTFCNEQGRKILVTYASKCGATAEIAESIKDTLCAGGLRAELKRAGNVANLDGYQAVVLGTAIYMGSPLKEAVKFAADYSSQLANIPVALFDVCLTMKDEDQESKKIALDYLKPIIDQVTPINTAAFAGRIELAALPPIYRMFAKADNEGILAEGDFRNWPSIKSWAETLGGVLANHS